MPLKGVIFDFDGTIVSQEIDFKKIFLEIRSLLLSYRLKEPKKILPILEYLQKVKKINGKKAEQFLKQAYTLLFLREEEASKNTRPIPGVKEFLTQLKKAGFFIGIVTRNSRIIVERTLKKLNIPYDLLLAREDVLRVKPHPSHIGLILKKLKLKKSEVIVAGDHPLDVICAKKLGILSCGVLSGGRKGEEFLKAGADFIYNDITHLAYFLGLKKLPDGKLEHQLLKYLLNKYCKNDTSIITRPGIGVDASLVRAQEKILALKSDPITLVSKDIGTYAVTINANDIVCSGAKPRWLIATAIFPSGTIFPSIEEIFKNISQACQKQNVILAGGHTEISSCVSKTLLCCSMIGEKLKKTRQVKKVSPGDALILVKQVAIEGASILARENKKLAKKFPDIVKKALDATKKPGISIVREALLAWKTVPVIKMHDPTEGGIAAAIAEIAESAGCGFIIDEKKVSFYGPAKVFSRFLKINPYGLISSGCLLVLVPKKYAAKLINAFRKNKIPASVIGHAIKEKNILLKKGREIVDFKFSASDELLKSR
ncbi:MAG: HAD-IA family hydrolase [Candidatus Omnitrophica bacterium]|nr:HAD-IA family hydrolase [Candidatus Omnitrophota bacterium]